MFHGDEVEKLKAYSEKQAIYIFGEESGANQLETVWNGLTAIEIKDDDKTSTKPMVVQLELDLKNKDSSIQLELNFKESQ